MNRFRLAAAACLAVLAVIARAEVPIGILVPASTIADLDPLTALERLSQDVGALPAAAFVHPPAAGGQRAVLAREISGISAAISAGEYRAATGALDRLLAPEVRR
jgi:hypothetical protein